MSEDRDGADGSDGAGDLDALDDLLGLDPDAGDELDPEPQGEVTEDQPPPQPQPPPQTRGQRRVQALQTRLKAQEDENRRLRDAWLNQQRQPPPQPDPYRTAEVQRLEAERVSLMSPAEAAQHYAAQAEQRMNSQFHAARFEVGDLLDRQSFQQLMREEPLFRKYADQVDEMLRVARQNGNNPTREALANQLLAQQVRENTRTQSERQRRRGREAIARQTTQPGNGTRSTAAAARRGEADDHDAVVERLKNTRLGDVW